MSGLQLPNQELDVGGDEFLSGGGATCCRWGWVRYVFLNSSKEPFRKSPIRRWFEEALIQARVKEFTWHCLRHTYASRLVMAGVDLRTVQELMGHKTIQMTVRYSHLSKPHLLEATERLVPKTGTKQVPAKSTRPIGTRQAPGIKTHH